MKKYLIAIISASTKTPQQVKAEVADSYNKYRKAKARTHSVVSNASRQLQVL
jgi:hypothetical protein